MRSYECMYIITPDVADDNVEEVVAKYSAVVTDNGGEIVQAGLWDRGRRALAYEIRRKREGIYILMLFKSANGVPKELERIFGINADEILRYLVTRSDGKEQ